MTQRAIIPTLVAAVILFGVARTVDGRGGTDAQGAGRTVWDGVYTGAQADRGRASYQQACVACHRDDLRGDNTAPSLVGESFTFLWGEMPVGELSSRIQKMMPPERPGVLPVQIYIDIVAFILQKNEFPTGDTELGADPGSLQQILITTKRPAR